TNQQSMQPFLAQEYSLVDKFYYKKIVLSATIENGWAFNWVKKKSSIAMLKYKNPNLVIPSCHTLEDYVLKNAIQKLYLELASKAINNNIGVSLAFDVVEEIFKENTRFNNAIKKVIKITNYFNNPNNSYFIGKLRNKQKMSLAAKYVSPEDDDLTLSRNICEPIGDNDCFLLHPNICLTQFKLPINDITYAEIGKWIIYYYCVWFGDLPKKIIAELQNYRDELFPFSKNE
ncbi:22539_t:CDS:2, partial [Cetraspora pellucida]